MWALAAADSGPRGCIYCTNHASPASPARHISRVHNQSHNKFYFTPLCWAQCSPSQEAWVWRCPVESTPTTDMNINLLRKPRVKRHDLIYQFPGNAPWEEGHQCRGPISTCEPGGAATGALETRRGPWALESPKVRAPSQAGDRGCPRRRVPQKPLADGQGSDHVSGGAGARRPRAGGCARNRLCRRSGRSRSCSRSARSCTAARAGSALGTHRCLEVGRQVRASPGRQSTQPA